MSNLFWLTDAQMARLQPFFPKALGENGAARIERRALCAACGRGQRDR